jgi:hypothetical protein
MAEVAQGATWSDTTDPIVNVSGALVSNAVSAGHLIVETLVDSANVDQSTGATLAYVANGVYRVTKAIGGSAALGTWAVTLKWDNTVEPVRRYAETFDVITAQQADPAAALDPTALADAATAIQTSLDNLTTFIDETADLSTLSESLAALSASAAAIQSAVTAVSTELGDITTINDLQDAVTAINSKIGTISVAQLPLATGTGGAAIWAKEVV